MTRGRRSGVEDLWHKTIRDENGDPQTVRSKRYGTGKRWRARYVADDGREQSKAFDRQADAKQWLRSQDATVVTGTHVAPRDAQITVQEWCDTWIEGYKRHRAGTVRQARTHIKQIITEFRPMPLSGVRPSQVNERVARLRRENLEASYICALHKRLAQMMGDAVRGGVLGRNPCSRRTSPPMGKPKMYVARLDQVWALHDAMPEHLRVAVLLGAFCGLRVAEVSGLRLGTSTSCGLSYTRSNSTTASR